MSSRTVALAFAVMAATAVGAPSLAYAQARVEQEELLITDPTVSASGQWVVGAAIEGTYGYLPIRYTTATGSNGTGSMHGGQAGGSVQIGYGDLWVQALYLTGSLKATQHEANTLGGDQRISFRGANQFELLARYVLRDSQFLGMTPYLIAGYDHFQHSATGTILNANVIFTATGTNQQKWEESYNSAFIGFGGLSQFTERTGLRIDAELGYSMNGKRRFTNLLAGPAEVTRSGLAAQGHLTVYYKVTDGLVVQAGARAVRLARPGGGAYGAVAPYLNVGYVTRF